MPHTALYRVDLDADDTPMVNLTHDLNIVAGVVYAVPQFFSNSLPLVFINCAAYSFNQTAERLETRPEFNLATQNGVCGSLAHVVLDNVTYVMTARDTVSPRELFRVTAAGASRMGNPPQGASALCYGLTGFNIGSSAFFAAAGTLNNDSPQNSTQVFRALSGATNSINEWPVFAHLVPLVKSALGIRSFAMDGNTYLALTAEDRSSFLYKYDANAGAFVNVGLIPSPIATRLADHSVFACIGGRRFLFVTYQNQGTLVVLEWKRAFFQPVQTWESNGGTIRSVVLLRLPGGRNILHLAVQDAQPFVRQVTVVAITALSGEDVC